MRIVPVLLNDILIALCARRIGATLLTYSEKDFRPFDGTRNSICGFLPLMRNNRRAAATSV